MITLPIPYEMLYNRVSQPGPATPLGATEQFSGAYEQRPLLNSSAVILQKPIDEQGP